VLEFGIPHDVTAIVDLCKRVPPDRPDGSVIRPATYAAA
jgi:hypothetical protein